MTIKKNKEAGTEWDNTSLIVTVKPQPQAEPQDEPQDENSEIKLLKQVIELQGQAIEDNQNQIKELKDYLIRAILRPVK